MGSDTESNTYDRSIEVYVLGRLAGSRKTPQEGVKVDNTVKEGFCLLKATTTGKQAEKRLEGRLMESKMETTLENSPDAMFSDRREVVDSISTHHSSNLSWACLHYKVPGMCCCPLDIY